MPDVLSWWGFGEICKDMDGVLLVANLIIFRFDIYLIVTAQQQPQPQQQSNYNCT